MLIVDDPEFVKYVPIMYEIAYILMFRLYEKHREPGVDQSSNQELMPEIDLGEVLPGVGKEFEYLNSSLKKVFTQKLFSAQPKLERKRIVARLSENLSELLVPHCLRITAWKKYVELR